MAFPRLNHLVLLVLLEFRVVFTSGKRSWSFLLEDVPLAEHGLDSGGAQVLGSNQG